MLVSEWVEVSLKNNVKYYESLGYKIPKTPNSQGRLVIEYGYNLKVKVSDLSKGSHIKVIMKCDLCGKEREIEYREYIKNYLNKQYLCDDCKREIKFNEFVKNLECENYQVLSTIEDYENCFSKIKFTCRQHKDKGVQFINSASFNQGTRCKYCSLEKASIKNRTDFSKIVNDFENKGLLLLIEKDDYINSDQLLPYICYKHKDEGIQYIRYRAICDGQGCKYCGREKIGEALRLKYDYVYNKFDEHNLILLTDEHLHTNLLVPYKCKIHNDIIQYIRPRAVINENEGCPLCAIERKSGENSHLWKGGISSLTNYMRNKLSQWRYDSLKNNNFKCILTNINDGTLIVHHLYSYTKILEETLYNLKIDLKGNINNYSNEELKLIENECIGLHYEKGLGIPLAKCLHDIFHSTQGDLIIDNGEFEEFTQRYKNFEFDDLLEDKYKYCNVKLKEVS
jgi:hypothetical protein